MTWGEITKKIQENLNVPGKRAYAFVQLFKKDFDGFKEAINDFEASFTKEGYIELHYKIGDTYHSLILKNKKGDKDDE